MHDFGIEVSGSNSTSRSIAASILAKRERYAETYGAKVSLVTSCTSSAGVADEGGRDAELSPRLERNKTDDARPPRNKPNIFIEAGLSSPGRSGPDLAHIRHALAIGCDVVAISPNPLIDGSRGLRDLVRAHGSFLTISAAAGGALPAMDMLQHSLAGCSVTKIEGIFSNRTNNLLDAMTKCGLTLQEALEDVSEADPEIDVMDQAEGWATARTLLLLANYGLGVDLTMDDLTVRGIMTVTEKNIAHWRAQAATPRLVGTLVRDGGRITGTVDVRPYYPGDQMALVRSRCSAIRIATAEMGELFATSCGSEPDAALSTALKDVEHIMRMRTGSRAGGVSP